MRRTLLTIVCARVSGPPPPVLGVGLSLSPEPGTPRQLPLGSQGLPRVTEAYHRLPQDPPFACIQSNRPHRGHSSLSAVSCVQLVAK